MKHLHGLQGLLFTVSALALGAACTDLDPRDEPTDQPVTTLAASARSTADLGVTTWEVSGGGAAVRVIGRDAASARQVELIVHRDDATPDERVQIEALFPARGELALTRTGLVEGAASDYLRTLGTDVQSDLGQGAIPTEIDRSTTSSLAISFHDVIHLGWNLWGYTVNATVGGRCPTGTTRHHGEIYADYGAFSLWLGWSFSAPITDCTSKFTMSVQNGHWDDFHWAILTSP